MRMFALLGLHELGVGKNSIDEAIQTEMDIFADLIEKLSEQGDIEELKEKTQKITANIIHNIIFGERFVHIILYDILICCSISPSPSTSPSPSPSTSPSPSP